MTNLKICLDDWKYKTDLLIMEMRAYEERYRERYKSMTEEELKRRNYRIVNGKEYCDLMPIARTQYFRDRIVALLQELNDAYWSGKCRTEKNNHRFT